MALLRKLAIASGTVVALITAVLFLPPLRDWFFGNKMMPLPTPWDVTPAQVKALTAIAEPGDIVVERNWHSWHWMLFCKASTGSSWVHTALVERPGTIITMSHTVKAQPFSTYLEKQSTDLVLLRPNYPNAVARQRTLTYARSKIGTPFDPDFENPAGSCAGLVGAALKEGGITVPMRKAFGFSKNVYAAVDFLGIENSKVIWTNRKIKFDGERDAADDSRE
jgi:hypothetical protein